MEKDDEVKGSGNSYDFGNRVHDSRLGRFLSVDRIYKKTPGNSPYSFASNMVIAAIDFKGDSTHLIIYGAGYLNYKYKGKAHDNGNNFKLNAEALKKKIESSSTFDPARDEVVIVYAPNTKRFVEATNKNYPRGKIATMTVFSHGYGYSSTNGTNTGGVSLGGESPNEIRPDGTVVTQKEADDQLNNYDLREVNGNTLSQLDKSNFEPNARITFYGCYIGGSTKWTETQVQNFAFGQKVADYFGGKTVVNAFTGSGLHKTDKAGKIIYDGTMIRAEDVNNQQTKLTKFKSGAKPKIPSKPALKP
jgi:hypothetical protein